jgi:hypothetical protein
MRARDDRWLGAWEAGLFVAIMALAALGACGGDEGTGEPEGPLYEDTLTSECGGLGNAVQALTSGDYCAAEVLDWAFDAETGELALLHQRTTLNCCGEHSVSAAWDGEQIVVTAVDAPEGMGARCACMCVYDFGLTVLNVPAGAAPQALVWRERVTDAETQEDGGVRVVFDGTLDLGQGAGRVVISDTESMWCQEEP